MKKEKNKRGQSSKKAQITIFIILALILVVGIALIFILKRGPPTEVVDVENPQLYIESCVKDSVEESLDILIPNGGDLEPKGSTMYNGKNVTYLCYNTNYYNPCINQRPMLIKHIEEGITTYIEPKVNNCFQKVKSELEDKNYNTEVGNIRLTTELQTNQILINMKVNFKMSRGEATQTFDNFKVNLASPIYDLAEISNEIASQEAKYCYFNVNGFNMNYPGFEVRKDMISDSKIYSVRKKESDQNFIFAIRGCVMPPGF